MRISDWSSDVCSSDLGVPVADVDDPDVLLCGLLRHVQLQLAAVALDGDDHQAGPETDDVVVPLEGCGAVRVLAGLELRAEPQDSHPAIAGPGLGDGVATVLVATGAEHEIRLPAPELVEPPPGGGVVLVVAGTGEIDEVATVDHLPRIARGVGLLLLD